jgi:CBS domain containing-hemolysin-like protein
MSGTWWAAIVGLSILLNGFFAGMETGVTSARLVRLVHWARRGRRGASLAAGLVRRRERSVVTAVVGNNVAVVVGTSLATTWAVAELGARGETVAGVSMAALNIVFGEILPKTAFRARPESLLVGGAPLFRLFGVLLWPVQALASTAAGLILRLLRQGRVQAEDSLTRLRLLELFALSRERQQLDPAETRLLEDFVGNSHRAVERVMTPWKQVSRVRSTATVADVFAEVRRTGHSRLPVEEPEGSLRGLVLYRDLQGMDLEAPISGRIRDYVRIPSQMALDEALAVLTDRQVSLAIVVGPGPDPVGIVTVEDLLEPFVGDILDEHDEREIPNLVR